MKILFLQNSPDVIGGVEFVNKALAEGFLGRGHQVSIYSMRFLGKNEDIGLDKRIRTKLINEKDLVDRPSNRLALYYFNHLKIIPFIKQMFAIIWYFIKMRRDYLRMREAVSEYNPDIIIVSYMYMLDVVPKYLLNRVIAHVHYNFEFYMEKKFVHSKLNKYKNRIFKVVWGTHNSCKLAESAGFKNAIPIYNPIRFTSDEVSDIKSNRKAVYIGRISPEKQVDLIIQMFHEVITENKIEDWCLDIFGSGELNEVSKEILQMCDQIQYRGITLDIKGELLKSSILMLASKYESFSLVVFEANECGVPAIAFEFGEPTSEAILNEETGIVIPAGDIDGYKRHLLALMTNIQLREKYAINAKEHAKLANVDTVLDRWEMLFVNQ